MQSTYYEQHSTETALLQIRLEQLMSIERKNCVLMVILDLLSAFDMVHYKTLPDHLSLHYGITENAHAWITHCILQAGDNLSPFRDKGQNT